MRVGSLFSGYGGLDLAVCEVFGAEVTWHSQYEPPDKDGREKPQWASKVLEYRWPGVPNLGDINLIDFSRVEPVDIVCGGFPCQDVSFAGRRAGITGPRTGLWSEMLRAVSDLQPKVVVIENVPGLLSGEWMEEPDDRCVCGWPCGRRGMHQHSDSPECISSPRGHRHDRKGQGPAAAGAEGVRRPFGVVPRSNGEVGCGLHVGPVRAGRRGVLETDRWPADLEVGAGAGRVEGQGCMGVDAEDGIGKGSMDGRGSGAVRSAEAQDARVEQEGFDVERGDWVWDAGCPSCGRDLGDRSTRSVFRSGLSTVLRDLSAIGFDAEWASVRASDVGAPHRRERLFVVAYTTGPGSPDGRQGWPRRAAGDAPDSIGYAVREQSIVESGGGCTALAGRDGAGSLAHAECGTRTRYRHAIADDGAGQVRSGQEVSGRCRCAAADTASDGRYEGWPESKRLVGGSDAAVSGAINWGIYGPAIRRWEGVLERSAPSPWQISARTGNRQLSARFTEWLMGCSDGWVTDVPGMTRNGALHVLGNGVVTLQAVYALRLLLERAVLPVAS